MDETFLLSCACNMCGSYACHENCSLHTYIHTYAQKEKKKKIQVTIFETIPSWSYALINSGWFPRELEPWRKNVYTTELKNRTSALNMTNLLNPLTSLPQGTRPSFKPYFIRDQHRGSLQRPLDIKRIVSKMFFDIFHRRLPAVPGDSGHRPTTYLSGRTCSLQRWLPSIAVRTFIGARAVTGRIITRCDLLTRNFVLTIRWWWWWWWWW